MANAPALILRCLSLSSRLETSVRFPIHASKAEVDLKMLRMSLHVFMGRRRLASAADFLTALAMAERVGFEPAYASYPEHP